MIIHSGDFSVLLTFDNTQTRAFTPVVIFVYNSLRAKLDTYLIIISDFFFFFLRTHFSLLQCRFFKIITLTAGKPHDFTIPKKHNTI